MAPPKHFFGDSPCTGGLIPRRDSDKIALAFQQETAWGTSLPFPSFSGMAHGRFEMKSVEGMPGVGRIHFLTPSRRRIPMRVIKVEKAQLIAKLKENREQHAAIVAEAQAGFREYAVGELDKALTAAKGGKVQTSLHFSPPSDHTKQFDVAIEMLEMHIGDTIEVTSEEFSAYVRNDWDWMHNFLASNSRYSDTAAALSSE